MAKKLILDSTVIVKWLNQNKESDIEKADKILDEARLGSVILISPELSKYELIQIFHKNKNLTQTESKIPLGAIFELPIQFIALTPDLAKEAYAIAVAYDLSFYLGVYLALTEQKNATYITATLDKNIKNIDIRCLELKDY